MNNATAWAVFLGCNTIRRLADEMKIGERAAADRLIRARNKHLIELDIHGIYAVRQGVLP